jgi:hypothetical protein
MDDSEIVKKSNALGRERRAESLLADIFKNAGWRVTRESHRGGSHLDFVIRRPGTVYAVEVKAGAEGRSDRLVPLFAQAVLQSSHAAGEHAVPLAVVAAPKISNGAADQVFKFAELYAPDAAIGVIDFEGLRKFRGPQLEELNADPRYLPPIARGSRRVSGHLFSDLDQWMLKVLLAPEIPETLLSAPRGQYRNASELARAARVSVMSACRFVQQLRDEGYLKESVPYLDLVRRQDLFHRWQASAAKPIKEVPMRYLLRGNADAELRKMLSKERACLALFAAANALKLGFVDGVPPYLYVERIQPSELADWKNVRQSGPGEPPDLIVRQAPTPQSIFRGLVRPEGVAACDVLQVWVDVSTHPSRGREQAALIRKTVLDAVISRKR